MGGIEDLIGKRVRLMYPAVDVDGNLQPDLSQDPNIKITACDDTHQYHEEVWMRPAERVKGDFVSKKVFELVGGRLMLIVGDQEI